jgi:hypothetical protein
MRDGIGRRVYWSSFDHPVCSQTEENHDEAGEEVDHVVVPGENDRGGHRRRPGDRERPHGEVAGRAPDRDTGEDVPAEVEARERGELVRQTRRLERAVGVRMERDRVDEVRVRQARRRHGEKREEEEPDRAGDQDGVAEQPVARVLVAKEDDCDRDDHRPVPPDVGPVGERDDSVVGDDLRLEPALPGEVNGPLEGHDVVCVRVRRLGAARGQVANAEVRERCQACVAELPKRVTVT